MKTIILRKKAVFISILIVCFIWLGYFCMVQQGNNGLVRVKPGQTVNNGEEIQFNQAKQAAQIIDVPSPELNSAVNDNYSNDYFVNYRIEREKIRSHQIEILEEIVNNPNSISEAKKQAQDKLLALTQTMENELKLENLIKSKRYEDTVVLIQPKSAMVVVKGDKIVDEDTIRIAELVSNSTGLGFENIIITTKD
ncbi:MAG: SpoIIIAH-like family protein [Bacillota bacterium]|jgi:stage III sporulation protein AH